MSDVTPSMRSNDSSRANLALALSGAAVVLFVIAMIVAQEDNDWMWPAAGLLGGVGALMGWRTARPRPQGKALVGVVLGGLVFAAVLGWIIWAVATGNF